MPVQTIRFGVASCLLGALAACSAPADRSAAGTPTVRDSAGVRLVEYAAGLSLDGDGARVPDSTARWQLAAVPDRDAPELYRLLSATMLPDGRAVVAHSSGRELLLVDATGALVRIIGRPGSGPGEFRAVASVFATAGAEILAFDQVQRRVIRFDTLGAVLDQRSVATPTQPDGTFRPSAILGGSPGGDPLVRIVLRAEQPDPVDAIVVRTAWLRAGDTWHTVGRDERADDSVYTVPRPDGSVALTMVPFAPQPLFLVCGDRVVRTNSHGGAVSFESLDGALRSRAAWPAERIAASDDDLRLGLAAGVPPGERVPDEFVALTRTRRADIRVPAIARLVCDPGGAVWLVRWPRAGATRQLLTVVSPDGIVGETVSVPLAWRVLAVAGDLVLTALVQDDGTESLTMWRVASER